MSTRAWTLLAAAAVLWGMPYLLIKVAVADLDPVVIVFARTAIAAALLAPLALRRRAFAPLRTRLRAVTAVAVVEVTLPFLLITTGERYISSSLTALLIAVTPLVAALIALQLRTERLEPARITGLVTGLVGLALLLGVDVGGKASQLAGAGMVVGAACCYASGAVMIGRLFTGLAPLGVVSAMLAVTSVLLAPATALRLPDSAPSAAAVGAVLALAVASTAAGFLVFFALIDAAGASRATVVTYLSPTVAVALGVVFLDEQFTAATAVAFALILAGSALATGGRAGARPERGFTGAALVHARRLVSRVGRALPRPRQ